MGVVDRRQRDVLFADIGPDVVLGPVRQREGADVFALAMPTVVEAPQFGPLRFGVPLAELVAEAEHPLLGAGLLLVAAGPAESCVELVLPQRPQQGDGLQRIARRSVVDHPAGIDVLLHTGHHQAQPVLLDELVAGGDHLVEVVAGVHVHHRKRNPGRREGLDRQVQHHDRVFTTGEQQHRVLKLGRHLTDNVDGLGLQGTQVAQFVLPRPGGLNS